jgi:formate dehydrogenase iron-sulfur subunit
MSPFALETTEWHPPGYDEASAEPRKGFFTDTSLCIGCKACEVACKEWNDVPMDDYGFKGLSMDNTGGLGASTWRHVAFIEQRQEADDLVQLASMPDGVGTVEDDQGFRWLMASDVCKHCTNAACLEVCPTGSLFRTEFGTVVVQEDICNGCGYCVPACPFGVIDRREEDGRAWKCTLCYDRLRNDQTPACAKACPTQSIQYGELEVLRVHAAERVEQLQARGETKAQLYLDSPDDGVGGAGAFFLLLDDPEVYGLPPDPVDTTNDLVGIYKATGWSALALGAAGLAVALLAR